jgi:hypothetical protein
VEDTAKMGLTHVNLSVKAVRMTGLIVDGGTSGVALADGVFDEVEVPV